MKKLAVLASYLVFFLGTAVADVNYSFKYIGSSYQATGTLDVNSSDLAVSGSGRLTYDNGGATTALTLFALNPAMAANIGGNGVRANDGTDLNGLDNRVFPGSHSLLDGYGLIFWSGSTTPVGALADTTSVHPFLEVAGAFNIYSNGSGYSSSGAAKNQFYDYQDYGSFALVPETSSSVVTGSAGATAPEPGGVPILLAGLAGLALVLRKRLA